MFCNQCEQTSKGKACTRLGICGKNEAVAIQQDKLVWQLRELAAVALMAQEGANGLVVRSVRRVGANTPAWGLSNVNFDPVSLRAVQEECLERTTALAARVPGAPAPTPLAALDLRETAIDRLSDDEDVRSAMQILLYGLKGVAAYADHAAELGQRDPDVAAFLYRGLRAGTELDPESHDLNGWLGLVLECGKANLRAMELLGKPASAVLGVTMPGFGTTDRTYRNALDLMEALGVTRREISIADACVQHMADIGHDPSVHDITYENTQARERTQILFDLANKEGCLLVGTGDLSELAMGWCTYNGDHMSMYGVNASVPKTLVRYLVDYVAGELGGRTEEILRDVLDTPVSPELLPPDANGKIAQKTEEKIGPYELHDFFLYHFVRFGFDREKLAMLAEKAFDGRYDRPTIDRWLTEFLRRFFISQFKRSCIPDSPKVGSVSLSPRGDWRMPSDAAMQAFLQPDERI